MKAKREVKEMGEKPCFVRVSLLLPIAHS